MSVQYETLKRLRYLARPGDWCIAIDIADGFHAVAIAPEHRCYMTFRLQGQLFRHAVLPLGWKGSPAVFAKVMRVFTRLVRSPDVTARREAKGPPRFPTGSPVETLRRLIAGDRKKLTPADWMMLHDAVRRRPPRHYLPMRTLPYSDDYLFLFPSRAAALEGGEIVRRILDFLGLEPSATKCTWEPTQRLVHLGLEI